jgi:hypothetical protein
MNHHTIRTGTYENEAAFAAEARRKREILNPTPPRAKLEAIKILAGGRMYAGKRREEGDILLVMPEQIPPGFVSKEDARDLVDSAYAEAATADEIAAFLDAQEASNPANQ